MGGYSDVYLFYGYRSNARLQFILPSYVKNQSLHNLHLFQYCIVAFYSCRNQGLFEKQQICLFLYILLVVFLKEVENKKKYLQFKNFFSYIQEYRLTLIFVVIACAVIFTSLSFAYFSQSPVSQMLNSSLLMIFLCGSM